MANDKKLDKKLIDQLLADYKEPEDITGENGLLKRLTKAILERAMQGHLEDIYGIGVSPTLISNVTDGVLEEVQAWQSSPLEAVYPIVYLDALMVKVRDNGHINNKAIYVVLGVNLEGRKEVLGLW